MLQPVVRGDRTPATARRVLAHGRPPCCSTSAYGLRELLARDGLTMGEWRCLGSDDARATQGVTVQSYEIIVTRQGAYTRHARGASERVTSYPGVVSFHNPGDEYDVSHPLPGGDVCSVFRLTAPAFRHLLSVAAPRLADVAVPRVPATDVAVDGSVYLRHRMAILAARSGAGMGSVESLAAEEWAADFLRHAVGRVGQHRRDARRTPEDGNRYAADYAARVREIVARRFREPLTLHEIAHAVGASPFHLSRVVRAHEGAPIYRLIVRLRLRVALEQILDTRNTLMAIALDTGFSSQSHLGDAFRREFGCSPGAVRRLAVRRANALPRSVRHAI